MSCRAREAETASRARAAACLAVGLALLPASLHAQAIDLSHGGAVNVTARDGIDLDQTAHTVTARGAARAVRGDVTVDADTLIARYRKKAGANATPVAASTPDPAAASPASPATSSDDTGSNEIYRLEAVGHVHIYTATDNAVGDRAIYDIDQAVMVMTGQNMKIVTPQDTLTARDSVEYWSQLHRSVGRGDATVVTNDGRRVRADVLVGYTSDAPQPGATPAPKPKPASTDPAENTGKLQRVEAYGHVVIQTQTEIVHADRGVYVPDVGIARLVGNVHITRGQNQLNGAAAIVNMKTGIATLTEAPGQRVQGLVVPNDAQSSGGAGPAGTSGSAPGQGRKPAGGGTP